MKYFKERENEVLISDYAKELDKSSYFYEQESYYSSLLIDTIGDQYLPKSIIEAFTSFYHSFGGRYSVRSDKETIEGVLSIYRKHPTLSKSAVDRLGFIYIKDLFELYDLESVLDKLISIFGETDEAFNLFMKYTDSKAEELQKEYEEKIKVFDSYTGYSENYISYLKGLVLREHLDIDKVIESIPTTELVKKDEEHLNELSIRTRIFMGVCFPISYKLTRLSAKGEDISEIPGLAYHINTTGEVVDATFTIKDFKESIKQKTKEIE